jgi:site-specific recombinase XerD
MTTYSAGLRVSEVVRLELRDLDSDRGLVRVGGGKGRKDRYTLFSERLREELRAYYRVYRPQRLVFPSRHKSRAALDPHSAQRMFHVAKSRAGVSKQGGIHSLRHAFATHMLEAGVDLLTIQRLLGHRDLRTTAGYIQVAAQSLIKQISPLDRLLLPPTATEHP